MMLAPTYIDGSGAVVPQPTVNQDRFLEEILEYNERFLQVVSPVYKDYIDVKLLRRMSKIVKMSLVSARVAMQQAGVDQVDAIMTGTGMGCQIDTEKFLNAMIENGENLLTPTSFIHSTHNTMGGQIALMLGNKNHNLTYVHRTFSFESALLDAMMMIAEKEAQKVLVGGIDEITDESWLIKTQIDYYKKNACKNSAVYNDLQPGALSGEGSAFFVLSADRSEKTYAQLKGVSTLYKPGSNNELEDFIKRFLVTNELELSDIDLVIMGNNGDPVFDRVYEDLATDLLKTIPTGRFKHLCGEYDTASSFALWIASGILRHQHVPSTISQHPFKGKKPKNILIYNHFRTINHSLILVTTPDVS